MKDFNSNSDSIFTSSERDNIVQQIDILFDTINGEVLGETDFGADFYQFLWDLSVSNDEITQYTKQLIYLNVNLLDWDLSVETTLLEGTEHDIILVTIKISKDFETYEKTYKIN